LQNALKLPNDTKLVDSMKNVFAAADYISLNIPYINKPASEGGTHGIIGRDLLMTMKKEANILNFARGELVDSEALKDWFDAGATGKYVSDFPDDLLYNHENVILLPHLGASTEEAEDAAASMAAKTIQNFLENGEVGAGGAKQAMTAELTTSYMTNPRMSPSTRRFAPLPLDRQQRELPRDQARGQG